MDDGNTIAQAVALLYRMKSMMCMMFESQILTS